MTKGQANLIRAFCLWTVWVWATRIWNIWGDDTRGAGFRAVHTVLAVISVAFAVSVAWARIVGATMPSPMPKNDWFGTS